MSFCINVLPRKKATKNTVKGVSNPGLFENTFNASRPNYIKFKSTSPTLKLDDLISIILISDSWLFIIVVPFFYILKFAELKFGNYAVN